MRVRKTVRSALGLLSSRDRRLFVVSVLLQMATSALDILGVLMTGIVGALGVTVIQSGPPPAQIQTLADWLGLEGSNSQELVVIFACGAAIALLLKSLVSGLLTRRILVFLANRQAIVSARLTKELLSRPITFIQRRSSQETAYALIQGAGAATMQVLGQVAVALSEIALLVALSVTLFFLDPLITVASVAFFALIAFALQRALGNWAHRIGSAAAEAEIGSLHAIQEALTSYREVTVTDRRSHYVNKIQELRWAAAKVAADGQLMGLIPKWLFESALVIGGFALAAVLFATKDATAAVGTLALFLAASSRVMPSLLRLQGATLALRGVAGAAAPTFALAEELDHPLDYEVVTPNVEAIRRTVASGHPDMVPTVAIRNVTFSYPAATESAIKDVSLDVSPGQSVALVGKSGAGKTTLADIILGVLPPEVGIVKISGLDPAVAIPKWPGGMAYVPQNVSLTNASVRQNVALGLPEGAIDDSLVWEALERAHLADYLRGQRDGLDTQVGEGGLRLSGGQRQRLGIARALFSRPRILVLDEATSALDADTEVAITQTIQDLEGDVTTIIIAHRLSTIRHANVVVYLEDGRIVAQGNFEEVRQQSAALDRQATLLGIS
jgi:ABC-type multidrug transport system fused ATPase/permease subunit